MAAISGTSTQLGHVDTVTQDLASRLRSTINLLHRVLRHESLAGLSPTQASTLGSVYTLGNPTLGELAAVEQVQPPTMTRIVADLSVAGMVTRITDDADRRSARVRITPAGQRSLDQVLTLKDAFLVRRLAELGPEHQARVADLVALLEHLVGRDELLQWSQVSRTPRRPRPRRA